MREHVKQYFDDLKVGGIFVPAQGSRKAKWSTSKECLWEAPRGMLSKYPLKHLYTPELETREIDDLSRFFRQVLSVPDATWSDLTGELGKMRESGSRDFDRIRSIYHYLYDLRALNSGNLRQEFENKRLIFIMKNGQPGWYKTPECIWSSSAEIRGKATLSSSYKDLQDFFVDTLGVKQLPVQILYDKLLRTTTQTSMVEVKSTIRSLNELLRTEACHVNPDALLKAIVFPVKYPDNKKYLRSTDTEFAIVDREYLVKQLQGRIKLLDYSLEEVRCLKPFFEWTGLTSRYLSSSVERISSLLDGTRRPISMPRRDLKRKAHGLLRVAATFDSPRYCSDPNRLYQLLRMVDVVEMAGVSTVLSISQDGHLTKVKAFLGDAHIDETPDGLKIYVPMDEKAQQCCFASFLPERLAGWFMRDHVTQIGGKVDIAMVSALTALLTVDIPVVDTILDHLGIIPIPIVNEGVGVVKDQVRAMDQVEDDAASSEPWATPKSSTSEDLGGASGTLNTWIAGTDGNSSSPAANKMIALERELASLPSAQRHGRSTSAGSLHAPTPSTGDTLYRMLLDKVIAAARRATFPYSGAFDMSGLLDVLPREESTLWFAGYDGFDAGIGFRSSSQLERNKKIGAAGQLYAFELLSRLNPTLRDWGRENWRSGIRQYVTIHPDYTDMKAWREMETTGFTYKDKHGDLTAVLVDRGYLDREEWHNARPEYFLDVKTTTGPYNTPFYMSKYQYKRMQDVHNEKGHSKVYMILRVFNIESQAIGMSVCIDPERQRSDGRLLFTGETWSAVPGNRGARLGD
ncbi:ATPase-like, ATP-binding domain [Pleurostoma richardsiae]|uniref:ATPase-like, ATP-binding domain n=1 Tax=Pleurostoma richardsiae TaxID=41990 RepID=A0AA38RAQ4_9PEZI|nr:ATPase-like, ATP-binding domain [Pleurostoma richardsiae]